MNFKIENKKLVKILENDKNDFVLVDIRNKYSFQDAHIPKSINIKYRDLLKNYKTKLKKFINHKIILICDYDIKAKCLLIF